LEIKSRINFHINGCYQTLARASQEVIYVLQGRAEAYLSVNIPDFIINLMISRVSLALLGVLLLASASAAELEAETDYPYY
jgi:hypothetical protein